MVPHTVAVLVISVASDSGRVDNLTCPGPTEVLVHILVPLQRGQHAVAFLGGVVFASTAIGFVQNRAQSRHHDDRELSSSRRWLRTS